MSATQREKNREITGLKQVCNPIGNNPIKFPSLRIIPSYLINYSHNKTSQTGWLKRTEMDSSFRSETASRCHQATLTSETLGKAGSVPLPAWWLQVFLWFLSDFKLFLHLLMVFLLCLIKTPASELGARSNSRMMPLWIVRTLHTSPQESHI